jgi:hypothetical protein
MFRISIQVHLFYTLPKKTFRIGMEHCFRLFRYYPRTPSFYQRRRTPGEACKGYNLVLPGELFAEGPRIAAERYSAVIEVLRQFICLNRLVAHVEPSMDTAFSYARQAESARLGCDKHRSAGSVRQLRPMGSLRALAPWSSVRGITSPSRGA